MTVEQYRYGEGNLAYLIHDGETAAAIDGGAVSELLAAVSGGNLTLGYVLNTHDHADHTPGNGALLEQTDARFLSTSDLSAMGVLELGDESVEILATPGHTMDSVTFHGDDWLITGDTLFNGTVGNCYSQNYEVYFESIQTLLAFPPETRIFAGHDLVDYALGVATNIDPDNPHIEAYRKTYDPEFVVSTIDLELKVNPFVRFDDPALDGYRDSLGESLRTPYERWRAMMTVH